MNPPSDRSDAEPRESEEAHSRDEPIGWPRKRIAKPQAEAKLRTKAKVGFAIAIALTSLLGILSWRMSWRMAQQAAENSTWAAHTREESSTLEATLTHLLDVETGGRGFALTGSEEFLEPYESGRQAIVADLRALHAVVVDPDQARRLKVLEEQANAQVEDVEEVVAARQNGKKGPPIALLRQGKHRMDAARATVAEMEDAEKHTLEERTQRAHAASQFNISVIAWAALAGAICLFAAGATVSREIGISARARAQIDALNADLERRVVERTTALGESEGRLGGIIQSAMDSIITVDDQQRILVFNAAAEKMFLCPAAEALGQSVERFIPQRFYAAHAGHIKRFGEDGATTRAMGELNKLWAVRADGQEFEIEASISHVEAAGKKMFTVILRDVTERVRGEEMRERLAAVVDFSDDAIISKDMNGTITAWNRGAEKVFGYSSAEAMGQPMLMLFPPELVDEESGILARLKRGEGFEHFETIRVRKDGGRIDVSVTISPIKDGSGAIVGASKIARDITESKRAHHYLKESLATSEAALKELADQKFALDEHAIVATTDVQGTITYVNDKFCAISKYSRTELLGQNHRILNSGHHPEEFFHQMYHTIANGGAWHGEICNRAKDGWIYWVDTTIVPFSGEDGKPRQYVAIRSDITERKRAEEALTESLAASKVALKELADQKFALDQHAIVATTDVQGIITYVNDKFCAISKYSRQELVGQNHRILNSGHHPKEFFQQMYHTIANGQVWRDEICNRAKDGSIYWVDTTVVPFLDAAGKPRQYVAIRADITERKLAEMEIRQLTDQLEVRVKERTVQLEEANKELEAFAYSVAHDLRAPLRHISGFSKILVEDFNSTLDPEAQRYLQRIQEGAGKMGQLVDELLGLSRLGRQSLNLQAAGLNSIVAEVISMLQPEVEGRQIEWKIADLPFVECDPSMMKQVFQNLVSNALKYSRPRSPAVIEIGEVRKDGEAAIFVRDNGVGFNMKYSDKLFGVFQRLHRAEDFEGTGVGLATVQRIIKKHQGRIWAEAELDRGATFYFTVGSVESAAPNAQAAIAGAQP
jgi:PAS domain S-box-containing protein